MKQKFKEKRKGRTFMAWKVFKKGGCLVERGLAGLWGCLQSRSLKCPMNCTAPWQWPLGRKEDPIFWGNT
jgi:hypothetical protein